MNNMVEEKGGGGYEGGVVQPHFLPRPFLFFFTSSGYVPIINLLSPEKVVAEGRWQSTGTGGIRLAHYYIYIHVGL